MENIYDVIIIGGGPAGLTAAIYSARRALKTLVLSTDIGGQISKSTAVENYPGIDLISGMDLSMAFFNQAKKFGAEIHFEEVKSIKNEKEVFEVKTLSKTHFCKSIILAFGKKPRELAVNGEEELKGKGVTYCATCDAPFFKDKTVAVVGGGNSAIDAAILSANYASKVYLLHRGPEFRAEQILIDKIMKIPKIEILMETEIKSINGKEKVESISLSNNKVIEVDGVIVEVGFTVDRSLIADLVKIDDKNQVVTDSLQRTSVPGIFAAGDLTETPYKQVVISAGEAAKAALACFDYIQKSEGKKGIIADWH